MLQKIKSILYTIELTLVIGLLSVSPALAVDSVGTKIGEGLNKAGEKTGNSGSTMTFAGYAMAVVNFLLNFIGIIFFILLIYSGYLWMMARGNEAEVEKSKKITREAITGLIIIIIARLFTEFLITQVFQAANSSS